jgi:hypothetical protein
LIASGRVPNTVRTFCMPKKRIGGNGMAAKLQYRASAAAGRARALLRLGPDGTSKLGLGPFSGGRAAFRGFVVGEPVEMAQGAGAAGMAPRG